MSQPPDSIIKIEDVRTVAAGPSDIVMALQLADDKEARAIEMLKRKKQEIKDSLKSKKGAAVMGKMQLPNLILRLGIAIALMKRCRLRVQFTRDYHCRRQQNQRNMCEDLLGYSHKQAKQ